ncbi:MAG: ABC transporter permease, partial [Muribaculaceae bacterium]|nr:ABC transporter permease [Muribaculaceae bacterium]
MIYLSLPTIGKFKRDGRDNWVGNDCYRSYVRMANGTSMADVTPHIRRMLKENVDKEALEVFNFNIGMKPLTEVYASQDSVKTMIWVLSLLAFIILVSASLNYLLIVIGQLGKRGKEMAVRKCYGTSNRKIFLRIMSECVFFLVVSIALAVLIVLSMSDQCEMLLGYPASVLLSSPGVWIVETCVCVGLLLITGVIPAWIYCRTPVSHVFHQNTRKRRLWKLALLSVQFFATGLMFCLLVLVYRQYDMMSHGDMGYEYENIGYLNVGALPDNERKVLKDELSRLSCVEGVASAYQNFTGWAAGNNVWIDGDPRRDNQVNVADMYAANANLFDVLGMEFVQGETFREDADTTVHQVIVEERFIDVMKSHFGQKDDNIIGERFNITEHMGLDGFDEFTIVGVIRNIRRGGYNIDSSDQRAGVLFPTTKVYDNLYVRFTGLTPDALKEAQKVIDGKYSDTMYITPYKTMVEAWNAPVKRFGFSVMAAGIAILLITIIGLIGYTADEVQRRAKEIAIRKVNG